MNCFMPTTTTQAYGAGSLSQHFSYTTNQPLSRASLYNALGQQRSITNGDWTRLLMLTLPPMLLLW